MLKCQQTLGWGRADISYMFSLIWISLFLLGCWIAATGAHSLTLAYSQAQPWLLLDILWQVTFVQDGSWQFPSDSLSYYIYIWVRIGLNQDLIGKACKPGSGLRNSKRLLGRGRGGKVQEVTKAELGEFERFSSAFNGLWLQYPFSTVASVSFCCDQISLRLVGDVRSVECNLLSLFGNWEMNWFLWNSYFS